MKTTLIFSLSLFYICAFAQNNPDEILLNDYRPESIYKVPVTTIEKAAYPVIDMHSHPYAESEEDLDRWVQYMDAAGVQKSIIMTMAYGEEFDSLIQAYSKYKDRFDLWCGFDYTGYDDPGFPEKAIKELERCYQAGAKGIGELGDKGKGLFYCKPSAWGMHSDDDRMVPLFAKCAELNLPVNIHMAEPMWMYEKMDESNDGLMNAFKWRLDNKEGIVSHEGLMVKLENTLRKNPNTTFIACHLANCCYDLSIVGGMLDKYPKFFIDIGARFREFSPIPRTAKAFFIKYQDRIVYGTDMGIDLNMYRTTFRILETADEHFYDHDRFSYHWPLYGLDLPDEVLQKVYNKNAIDLQQR
jgi:predicted TIM-barrel fold metal-dependent hydrolase